MPRDPQRRTIDVSAELYEELRVEATAEGVSLPTLLYMHMDRSRQVVAKLEEIEASQRLSTYTAVSMSRNWQLVREVFEEIRTHLREIHRMLTVLSRLP